MTVFYDHQAFSLQDYGGITRIFSELIKGLRQRGHSAHLSLLHSENTHLKEFGLFENKVNFTLLKRRRIRYLLNEAYNIFDINRQNFDLYHPTYYNPALIKFVKNKPVVVTFHDMTHEKLSTKFPELKRDSNLIKKKKDIAMKATHIIAVSQNTKQDLIDFYGLSSSKITVIHLASSLKPPQRNKEQTTHPYLLFVGNRGLYKNFIPFLTAISPLLAQNKISLICAGGKNFDSDEQEIIRALNLRELVRQEQVDDYKLSLLYSNAIAFVFPSLYEGFGIPVMEAFSCDCPCVLSNTSSLPEIAADGAVYMNPYDEDSMYHAVKSVINDSLLRNDLVIKGRQQLTHFSWEKHVNETVQVYASLLNK
jgi:glycosyltransferase involved in cell wall biosynthesis